MVHFLYGSPRRNSEQSEFVFLESFLRGFLNDFKYFLAKMVRKCQVCKKLDTFHPELSFHSLYQNTQKYVRIIFHPSDIITKQNGLRYIKPGANPKPINSTEPEIMPSSSDSTSFWKPSEGFKNAFRRNEEHKKKISNYLQLRLHTSEAENEMRKLEMDPSEVSKIIPEKTASKKRKRRYIGDMASSDFSTPEKRRKNLQKVKQTVAKQRKRIHSLQMTASVSGPAVDIFERLLKGPPAQKYNPSLRSFALTLSFYSSKAYNFVRRTFSRTLPHLGTISKRYSSVDGSPGFTKEALIALTLKQKESSNPLLCNLVMDEMSIRRQVEWTGQKFTGYVDIGTAIDEDTLPEAREALVFMLVALNSSWKLPVGYLLLNGLSASTKAGLVNKCLEFIHESGVTITSLTFDGAPVNITMAEKLGADFTDPLNLKTSFKHPITNSDIYIYIS
ncbi:hypothetical protein NQ317_013237 [Molorchus minor]|uniref:DNA transposase THAP9 n=1 Tax=Molorchus minor TaxID=1323400 RepID=A0ABQ9JSD3_9CUCU|nr:hypothetical protein NQ317_013237 [Molorchus minor]